MNNHNPAKRAQQVTMMSEIPCPACSKHTLVSLTNVQVIPHSIVAPRRVQQEKVVVEDFHVLCLHCLYRAHWVPGAGEFRTAWESRKTANPRGGLISKPEEG